MQKLSNTKLITLVAKLLVLLLVAKVISLGVWWYLPSEGVELLVQKSYQPKYQRVSFSNMLEIQKAQVQEQKVAVAQASNIESLVLKGLYGSRFDGFAIIAKKSSKNKTTIVAVGQTYEEYMLKEIELMGVILTKASKDYRLSLEKSNAKYAKALTKVEPSSQESSQKEVSRADIRTYSNNPSLIWKNIGIQEQKEGDKLVGFKVTRVKRGSKMATLGLQKGDLIIKANNIPLTSINDVLKLYKQIDKLETLALIVLRNNQEKEIVYEIR